ncbi:hypothetical protein BH09SUM1_BH09SUM1_06580 [soil metagenome]
MSISHRRFAFRSCAILLFAALARLSFAADGVHAEVDIKRAANKGSVQEVDLTGYDVQKRLRVDLVVTTSNQYDYSPYDQIFGSPRVNGSMGHGRLDSKNGIVDGLIFFPEVESSESIDLQFYEFGRFMRGSAASGKTPVISARVKFNFAQSQSIVIAGALTNEVGVLEKNSAVGNDAAYHGRILLTRDAIDRGAAAIEVPELISSPGGETYFVRFARVDGAAGSWTVDLLPNKPRTVKLSYGPQPGLQVIIPVDLLNEKGKRIKTRLAQVDLISSLAAEDQNAAARRVQIVGDMSIVDLFFIPSVPRKGIIGKEFWFSKTPRGNYDTKSLFMDEARGRLDHSGNGDGRFMLPANASLPVLLIPVDSRRGPLTPMILHEEDAQTSDIILNVLPPRPFTVQFDPVSLSLDQKRDASVQLHWPYSRDCLIDLGNGRGFYNQFVWFDRTDAAHGWKAQINAPPREDVEYSVSIMQEFGPGATSPYADFSPLTFDDVTTPVLILDKALSTKLEQRYLQQSQ